MRPADGCDRRLRSRGSAVSLSLAQAVLSLHALEDAVGGSAFTYPVIVVAVAIDSVLPVAPGEAVTVTAAVLAAGGELSVVLVILAAMLGGMLGDNVSYGLGATLGRRAERRLFRGERSRTFAAGTLEMPWRRFLSIDVLAAAL